MNEVKNLMHSIPYTTQILRLTPQNDITTQSLKGEEVFVEPEWLRSTLTFALELRLILMSSRVISGSVSSLR